MVPDYNSFVQELSGTKEWKQLLEERRKALRGRVYGWLIGFALLILGCLLILFGSDGDTIFSGFGSLVMSVVLVIFFYRLTHKNYSAQYKKLIVPRLVSDVIVRSTTEDESTEKKQANRCTFKQNGCINVNLLFRVPLFEKYDHPKVTYSGEDLFSGTMGKTDFQFSDFVFRQNRDLILVDQNIDMTVFKGLVFIADFHKAFQGTTTLTTRSGKIYRKLKVVGSRMPVIDRQFNRLFRVATTDEITANYLLPADMMERFIALRKQFPRQGMALCLHEGMLVISVHEIDSFESPGLRKLEGEGLLRIYNEIKTIVEIIERLNLNLRIWSKQHQDFAVPKPKLSVGSRSKRS